MARICEQRGHCPDLQRCRPPNWSLRLPFCCGIARNTAIPPYAMFPLTNLEHDLMEDCDDMRHVTRCNCHSSSGNAMYGM